MATVSNGEDLPRKAKEIQCCPKSQMHNRHSTSPAMPSAQPAFQSLYSLLHKVLFALAMMLVSALAVHGEPSAISIASVNFDHLLRDWKKAAACIEELDQRQADLTQELKRRREQVGQLEKAARDAAKQIEEVGGESKASGYLKEKFMQSHTAFQSAMAEQTRWEKESISTLSQERNGNVNALLLEIQDTLKRSRVVSRYTMVINLHAGMQGQLPVFLHLNPAQVTDITQELLAELQSEPVNTRTR